MTKSRRTDTRRRPFETASCIPNKLAAQFPGRVKLQSLSLCASAPLCRLCKGRAVLFPPPPLYNYAKLLPLRNKISFVRVYSFHDLFSFSFIEISRALRISRTRQRLNCRSKMRVTRRRGASRSNIYLTSKLRFVVSNMDNRDSVDDRAISIPRVSARNNAFTLLGHHVE